MYAMEKAEAANRLKDLFIANISHEVRTPLNGLQGMVGLIKEKYQKDLSDDDEEIFSSIDSASRRITRTMDLILNYSLIVSNNFSITLEKINLKILCERIILDYKTFSDSKKLKIYFEDKSQDSLIAADEFAISKAVENLIDNAIRFTKQGEIRIAISDKNNGTLSLEVTDTGIGINTDYIPKIFEAYTQEDMGYCRSFQGVGLGLALTKKIVELHKASIKVASKKGVGSTFTIYFPAELKAQVKSDDNL